MKIAVVGAGVSGLVAAYLLHERHEVTVFEAAGYAGGHANTIRVDTPNETHEVDTGFIVFNDRNYPSFERLLVRLGVAWQPSTMSFSVSDGVGDFEYSGASPNGLFAKRRHLLTPWFHRMVTDLARFNRAARELLALGDAGRGPSLGEWLERQRFSRAFIDRLIVPQASAVWSAEPRQMWSFPARFLAEFFDHHGMLGFRGRPRWRVIAGGSKRYVDALTRQFTGRLRLATPVTGITRGDDQVLVRPAGGEPERFDEVVMATHSDQALALLDDANPREREVLDAIPYQHNEAVLHTDVRMLPRRRRAWASWNYHLQPDPAGPAAEPGRATVTYHMNRLQSLRSEREFCVTLNRTDEIDPARVIKKISYAHPVFTVDGVGAQRRFEQINANRHTHFCGAYWGWGFHEDGVRSAVRVAERLGGRL
ncbi:MAG TPA: FAD-dependent oxidoreductase [Solirubrobacteraceae bacterium]|nr:FAD-dependent oxidoreductase [Solirubrobacteraceae bacterium]